MTTQTPEQIQVGGTEPVTALAVVRESSVDRIGEIPTISNYGEPWWLAHYGSAVLDRAEQHLRQAGPFFTRWDQQDSIKQLRNARTDLKAVMEYLDGIAETGE